jgi:hypothetical protein
LLDSRPLPSRTAASQRRAMQAAIAAAVTAMRSRGRNPGAPGGGA